MSIEKLGLDQRSTGSSSISSSANSSSVSSSTTPKPKPLFEAFRADTIASWWENKFAEAYRYVRSYGKKLSKEEEREEEEEEAEEDPYNHAIIKKGRREAEEDPFV